MADDELEPLITECPSCTTRFRVSEAQLDRAGGKVRCGACLTVFNGVEHLTLESAQAYADEDQARQALDDVLDELAGDPADTAAAGMAGRPASPPAAARPAPVPFRDRGRTPPRGPIFAGFEEPDADSSGRQDAPDEQGAGGEPEADIAPAFQVLGGDADLASEDESTADAGATATPQMAPGAPAPMLLDTKSPGAGPAEKTAPAEDTARVEDTAPAAAPAKDTARADESSAADRPDAAGASAEAAAQTDRETVVFGERPARRPWVWGAIALGLVLLAAQVLWYRFDDWAKDPQWRGVYEPLCQVLGCELPQQRDSSLLTTRNLAVRTHPSEPDTLLVNAMIVNQAEFAQPFPVLELRFTTVRGNLVAGRRFEPEEYLAGDAAGLNRIPPRTPVQIELTMDDPGPEAVNYFLRLR